MVCTRYPSPIGTLTLVGEGNVLTGLWLEKDRPAQLPPEGHTPVFDRAVKWLDGYFQGQPPEISFDLRPAGHLSRRRYGRSCLPFLTAKPEPTAISQKESTLSGKCPLRPSAELWAAIPSASSFPVTALWVPEVG